MEGQIDMLNQFEIYFGITFVGWNFLFHPIKPKFSLKMGGCKNLLSNILGIYAYFTWAYGTWCLFNLCGIIREFQGQGPWDMLLGDNHFNTTTQRPTMITSIQSPLQPKASINDTLCFRRPIPHRQTTRIYTIQI